MRKTLFSVLVVMFTMLIMVPFAGAGVPVSFRSDGFEDQLGWQGLYSFCVSLKNGDDTPLFVDFRAKVQVYGSVESPGPEGVKMYREVAHGDLNGIKLAGPGGFNHASCMTMPITLEDPVLPAVSGYVILTISARVSCPSMGGHPSGGVRLWFNGMPAEFPSTADDAATMLRLGRYSDDILLSFYLREWNELSFYPGRSMQPRDAQLKRPIKGAACGEWATVGIWSSE